MPTQPVPATDSAAELHKLIGDDATATFESDPTFADSNPTPSASSENLEEQRPGAGEEFQAASPSGKGAGPDPDEEDEFEDEEDDDEEDDDLDEDEDEEDAEDEEDDDLEDDDEDDLDDDDDDEEEDEDEEEDADELKASASSEVPLLADGLLGYEDEAEDAKNRVDRVTGDAERKREKASTLTDDPAENPYDAYTDVDPEAVREEEVDSNVVIRPVKPMDLRASHAAA